MTYYTMPDLLNTRGLTIQISKIKHMKKISLIMIMTLIIGTLNLMSQKSMDVTHTLALKTAEADGGSMRNASIYTKKKKNYISIASSTGSMTSEIIQSNSNEFKFQVSEIINNELVNRYFIGTGILSEKIIGQYTTIVDGMQRSEMSGSFTLTKIKGQTTSQSNVGGHYGIVQPMFVVQDGELSSFFSSEKNYTIGFPLGITVKKSKNFAFDLEFVPFVTTINDAETVQHKVDLLIHPGLLWGLGNNITFGTRAAFELGAQGRYGFTPLLNFGNMFPNGFVEIVLPVRFGSGQGPAVVLAIHVGVGF